MSGLILTNNARSSLAAAVATGDGTITLAAGDGAKFPVFNTAGQWHPVTVLHSDGSFEIMKVTGRTNDVLTVTRAQEGTAAQAFGIGDSVELRITGAAMQDLISGIATLQTGKLDTGATAADSAKLGGTAAASYALQSWVNSYFLQNNGNTSHSGNINLSTATGFIMLGANSFTDTVNGSTWYGLGTSTVNGPNNVRQVQLAGWDGLKLKSGDGELLLGNNGQGLTWNSQAVWHAGNFNPANYASLNGSSIQNFSLNNGYFSGGLYSQYATNGRNAGDIVACRSGGTTGVIYLDNSGSHYLNFDGTKYIFGAGSPIQIANNNQLLAGNSGSTRHQTAYGYIDFGPMNAGYAHIYTDRPYFYFNADLQVNGNTVWHGGNFNPANKLDTTAKAADSTKWNGANKTVSTAAPSGGVDGDIWFQYS